MLELYVIFDRTFTLLQNLSSGTEAIDMKRMGSVIHRRILEALNNMEDQPHETFAFMCIGDFLYDDSEEQVYRAHTAHCLLLGTWGADVQLRFGTYLHKVKGQRSLKFG